MNFYMKIEDIGDLSLDSDMVYLRIVFSLSQYKFKV